MLPVSADDVGAVALARMVRDGAAEYLAPGYAAARDLPLPAPARASTLEAVVPGHTVVSGLAGLWIHRGGAAPSIVDLVGPRGLHRAKPGADARGWTLAFHSGAAADEPWERFASLRVASPARCVADALRWADLAAAIGVTCAAIRGGDVDAADVAALVARDDPRGFGAARVRSAWAAISSVTSDRAEARHGVARAGAAAASCLPGASP